MSDLQVFGCVVISDKQVYFAEFYDIVSFNFRELQSPVYIK